MLNITDIYKAYLQKLNEENRINRYEDKEHWFHASSSGMCMRKIYYNSVEQVESTPIDENTLRLFRLGDLVHNDIQDALTFHAEKEKVDVLIEEEIQIDDINVRGFFDICIVDDCSNVDILQEGIDYIGVGPIYKTNTKPNISPLGNEYIKQVSKILNENNFANDECILILRTILNRSKRLLKLKESENETGNIDLTISSFKPPIFWKEKELVKKQIQSWSRNEVKNIIYRINDLEILIKKNSNNSLNFVSDFVSNY